MLKNYLINVLEPTLIFGPLVASVGTAASMFYGHFNIWAFIILAIALVFAFMAIDLFDDYFDVKQGIDTDPHNIKTKFSGGGAFLPQGKITLNGTLILAIMAFFIALSAGLYFSILHPLIIPLIIIGVITVPFYSKLSQIPFVSEPLTTVNILFIVIAAFIIAGSPSFLIPNLLFAALPVGMASAAVLIVNEVPDIKVDSKYGRRSSVVMLKTPKNVSYFFIIWQAVSWLIIASGIVVGALPYTSAIAFAVIPLAFGVYFGMRNYKSPKTYEKCMGLDVLYTFIFIFLLALAYII